VVVVTFQNDFTWFKSNWVFRQLAQDAIARFPEQSQLKDILEMAQALGMLNLASNEGPVIASMQALKVVATETVSGTIEGWAGTQPEDADGQRLHLGAIRELSDLIEQQLTATQS
jgi:hypothetical protein